MIYSDSDYVQVDSCEETLERRLDKSAKHLKAIQETKAVLDNLLPKLYYDDIAQPLGVLYSRVCRDLTKAESKFNSLAAKLEK